MEQGGSNRATWAAPTRCPYSLIVEIPSEGVEFPHQVFFEHHVPNSRWPKRDSTTSWSKPSFKKTFLQDVLVILIPQMRAKNKLPDQAVTSWLVHEKNTRGHSSGTCNPLQSAHHDLQQDNEDSWSKVVGAISQPSTHDSIGSRGLSWMGQPQNMFHFGQPKISQSYFFQTRAFYRLPSGACIVGCQFCKTLGTKSLSLSPFASPSGVLANYILLTLQYC